jgi:hypothetical protein
MHCNNGTGIVPQMKKMELKMFIGENLVDSLPVSRTQLVIPGFIRTLKNELEERNAEIIDLTEETPCFFIDTIPSRIHTVIN